MAKTKTTKAPTRLISLRLPEPLVSRVDEFVSERLKATLGSISFNRSMAIQELLHKALDKAGL